VDDFTHCREFHAESAIRFEDTAPATGLPPSEAPAEILPAGISVAIALAAPVSSADPVGAEIEGRIAGNLLQKGRTVLGEGAIVRGRIRRVEPASGAAARSTLGLEFAEIEAAGAPLRFFADLESVDAPGSVERGRGLPGVAAISMPGPASRSRAASACCGVHEPSPHHSRKGVLSGGAARQAYDSRL